jgi:hypothetical protein
MITPVVAVYAEQSIVSLPAVPAIARPIGVGIWMTPVLTVQVVAADAGVDGITPAAMTRPVKSTGIERFFIFPPLTLLSCLHMW